MNNIQIKALMTKKVTCAKPDTPITEVIRLMHEHRFSCLVVSEKRVPVGIITERDMVRILATSIENQKVTCGLASEIMSSPTVVVNLQSTLFEALVISRSRKIRHLPVVDSKGKLTGLVTQSDMAQAHLVMIENQREVVERSIRLRTEELEKANEELMALSLEDALLEIGNRRAMEVDLQYTHESAKRYRRPYSLALLDIDYFKKYNDFYGHLEGDKALKRVAKYLKKAIRDADRIYRYGGEEFLLVMPETTYEQADTMARRLVCNLAGLAIPHSGNPFKVVTVSAGIGSKEAEMEQLSWTEIISEADQGLYRAKKNGRNQIAEICSKAVG